MDPFAARHRFDRWFWTAFVAAAWFVVAMGFKQPITQRFTGEADYLAPPVLVIHVWAFFAWLTILTVQVMLAETRQLRWHRLLGTSALVVAPVMAWSAIAAEVYSQQFYGGGDAEGVRFFPIPVTSIICFITCVALALVWRARPGWHKRLVYLATSAVLVAGFFRWWGDAIYGALPEGLPSEWAANYAGVILLLAIGAGYDLVTRGAVHPVYKVGAPLFLLAQITAVTVGQSEWWPPIGRELLGLA